MNEKIIYLIAFLSGVSIMVLELTGARIIAPYAGTSLFVWSSLISVVLTSLSIGYWAGGYLSDANPSPKILSLVLLISSVSVAIIGIAKDFILQNLQLAIPDVRIFAIIACILLFSIPNISLGIISPYAAKLLLKTIKESGKTVGRLYSISTMGSIFGTIITGFFLISFFKNTSILYIVFLILIICSIFAWPKNLGIKLMIVLVLFLSHASLNNQNTILEFDSEYHKISIVDIKDSYSGRTLRQLSLGGEVHSGIFLDSDELVYDYLKSYDLISILNPNFSKTLMIGGGAFTYPLHYIQKYPNAEIDVVEIDPKLTEISKKYFNLRDNPRLNIINEDGRTFLNRNKTKYDALLMDAFFSNYSIPYHLTTKETASKIYKALNKEGIVIINLISSLEGKNSKFFISEYKTYKEVFPVVKVVPISGNANKNSIQNIMIIAFKSRSEVNLTNDYVPNENEVKKASILTDDYAPVDQYISAFLSN